MNKLNILLYVALNVANCRQFELFMSNVWISPCMSQNQISYDESMTSCTRTDKQKTDSVIPHQQVVNEHVPLTAIHDHYSWIVTAIKTVMWWTCPSFPWRHLGLHVWHVNDFQCNERGKKYALFHKSNRHLACPVMPDAHSIITGAFSHRCWLFISIESKRNYFERKWTKSRKLQMVWS